MSTSILKGNNPAASRVQQATAPSREFERAAAFLNINVPTKSGSATGKRFMSLPLLASDEDHAALTEWLADPATRDARLETLKSKFILQYQIVASKEDSAIDLG